MSLHISVTLKQRHFLAELQVYVIRNSPLPLRYGPTQYSTLPVQFFLTSRTLRIEWQEGGPPRPLQIGGSLS